MTKDGKSMSPFIKIKSGKNKGKYRSESGRVYTQAQMKLYYATEGFTKSSKKFKK
jgi:Holliday junction resolvase-like predicted endonuclease